MFRRWEGNEVTVTVKLFVTHYVRGDLLETRQDCCTYFYWLGLLFPENARMSLGLEPTTFYAVRPQR